mmetsp:Transcript_36490/g.71776  ORF Transcript_36490/g.71776 Transcript_36490/m.71776 type:complete len:107 (-) Transcript_36490:369-689(-)
MSASFKPGQKYPTPTPGFGDRVFYETLHRQRPDSLMAREWCLAYGVLSQKEAAKLAKGASSGGKSTKRASGGSVSKSRLKAKVEQEAPADIGMSVGGAELVGSSAI